MFYLYYQVTPVDPSDTVSSLQKQNEELRQVIKQMRLEMESLGDRLPTVDVQQGHNGKLAYNKVMDSQVIMVSL